MGDPRPASAVVQAQKPGTSASSKEGGRSITDEMGDVAATRDDPLAAFLSGKRASPRHLVSLDAVLLGPEVEVPVRLVDVSIGGTLIAIREVDMPGCDLDDPMRHLAVIERHFRDGFDLRILEAGVVVEADLIRLTLRPGEEGSVFLGCRFRAPLSKRQQHELGIAAEEMQDVDMAWDQDFVSSGPSWVPGPGSTRWIMLYDGSADLAGPRFVAEVRSLGKKALIVHLAGADLADVGDRLSDASWIGFRMMRGSKSLWQSQARLVGARYVETGVPGVELCLETRLAPPRAARRGYRKRV